MLFCTAGGTSSQLGFLADISATDLKACMEINYYSAAFITQSCLRRWLRSPSESPRTIVLTSSAAAFVGLPGYDAYAPAKAAVRALADTLRQELLLYGGNDKYRVHCCFPGTFVSEGFVAEQATKPNLTKELEKTNRPISELEKTYGTAEGISQKLIQGVSEGQFFVTMDADTRLLLNNMRGPSPRDRPLMDYLLGWFMGLVWPLIRRRFDRTTREYGRQAGLQSHL
ncbi:hypothetical protein ASPWEDRAFT_164019 [Aspergillus wentii DTO 134E9]|uniref:3-ketodihydrosphingosine reductase tsc10 n=1 Tax=Aspergillus wentii DTO 134E9 TaxID=1073089 RepID=A0A1L9R5A5_ASPWE|nr:uncharacterized protein ASPWEDRAFT_164019 [Aspergillus wentii DTO 134E9]KAI9923754.1 hypothetical protein MW887_008381 [Aspergillus wentii]OJJ30106.1 hypothetical protein ASPWEDRAFT_164019 [Aspergillus wentii DTO 134E9]